jgi:hypothetical protein
MIYCLPPQRDPEMVPLNNLTAPEFVGHLPQWLGML